MTFIVLGVIILVIAIALRSVPSVSGFSKIGTMVALGFILLGAIISSFVQIDAGYVGVTKLFGKVQPGILTSGLHVINPLYEVERLDVKTQNYTMSGINDEGHKSGDDAIRVLTADGLEVTIDLSVLYHVISSEAPRIIRETGANYEDKIIRPVSRTRIRDNAVYYEAVALYSTKNLKKEDCCLKTY